MKILRCLSWVAVSTKQQGKENSPEAQSLGNIDFINRLEEYYPDYKGSFHSEIRLAGTRSIPSLDAAIVKYPDHYGRIAQLVMNKEIDVIVCRERDRIGRKLGLVSQLEDMCDANDVIILVRNSSLPPTLDIASIRADESRPIVAAVEAALAETYVRRFRARSRDGREARVRNKKLFSSHIPYGYKYKVDDDGKKTIIKSDKAEVVATFFRLYMEGHGESYCVKYFNNLQIPAPTGIKWYRSSFVPFLDRVWVYAGYIDMYREKGAKGTFFRQLGNHEPIITKEMAGAIEKERQKRSFTRAIPHTAFAGVCICASCGVKMLGFTNRYKKVGGEVSVYKGYTCKNSECPRQSQIRYDVTRDTVRAAIEHVIANTNDKLITDLEDDSEQIDEMLAGINDMRGKILTLEEGKSTLVDILLLKRIDKATFLEKSEQIDDEIRALIAGIDEMQEQLNLMSDKNSVRIRLDQLRTQGLEYLSKEVENPELVSTWLKGRIRIYVKPGHGKDRIERVDYI